MARETTLEQLHNPHLRGPLRTRTSEETHPWAGRTTLNSGSASVTVSTALVNSDSIVNITSEVSSVGIGASSGGPLVVNSIVSGVSFAIARATGVATPWDATAMWLVIRT